MGFADKVISSQGEYFYKVTATDSTGRRAFYFILVDKLKLQQFLAIRPDGRYDLADFGKIIVSGYGEEPTQDVKDMLKRRFGFEFK